MLDEAARLAGVAEFQRLVEGSNVDDDGDFRPGRRAVSEKGVESPLRHAGLSKEEIRRLSLDLGLPTHNKPSEACLATRIPYGTAITASLLERAEASEAAVKQITGARQVRVRCHGAVARIEVDARDLPAAIERKGDIAEALRGLGFVYVALDLDGYRSGSMNAEKPGLVKRL
jgi:uncharacterized protein